jgi:hypothetical protein
LRRRKGVLPAELVPIGDTETEGQEIWPVAQEDEIRIGGRTGRTALALE